MSVPLSSCAMWRTKELFFLITHTDDILSQNVRNVSIPFLNSRIWYISGSHTCSFGTNMSTEKKSCWRYWKERNEGKKKGETRHFILHPFWKANSIIYTLWILPSGSLPEIPNIMLIWVHMTSLTNIKPPRSIVQLASKAHKQHGGTLCVCWGL